MNTPTGIWSVIFICGFAVGVFISSLFIINRSRYPREVFYVVAILVILSLMLIGETLEELDWADEYPMIIAFGVPLDLLIWSFSVLYLRYLSSSIVSWKSEGILIFLPFLVITLGQFFLYERSGGIMPFFDAGGKLVLLLIGFKMVSSLAFMGYCFRLINCGLSVWGQSNRGKFLHQIRKIFTILSIMIVVIYLLFFNTYFDVLNIPDSDRLGSLFITMCLYSFGYIVFTNPLILYDLAKDQNRRDTLVITTKGSNVILKLDSITWIESLGNYLLIHTENEEFKVRSTFSEFSQKLDKRFLRIHRSYIVNRDFIDSFKHWRRGEYLITLSTGKNLGSSRTYRDTVISLFDGHSVTS